MNYSVLLEQSIMQKGTAATAGSKMLEGFIAPISATVVERLEAADVSIAGRFSMGEFGVHGLFSDGAQSTEPVEAVNDFLNSGADAALCNDFTGVCSEAAAERGLYYIHPTYGTVSRYGLIPSVTSMDQIGVLCKSASVGFEVLKIIIGHDEKDGAMQVKNEAKKAVYLALEPSLPYNEIYPQIMQILCSAELCCNISRYDGIKFGHRAEGYKTLDELYTKSKTEAFGEDIKLAAMIGAMVLSADNYNRYYDKAMRLRRLIKESFQWDGYNILKYRQASDSSDSFSKQVRVCSTFSKLCGLPMVAAPNRVYIANIGCESLLEVMDYGL